MNKKYSSSMPRIKPSHLYSAVKACAPAAAASEMQVHTLDYHTAHPRKERVLQTATAFWAPRPHPSTWKASFCAVKEQNTISYLAHRLVSFYSSVSSCGWVSAMDCLSFLSSSAASS